MHVCISIPMCTGTNICIRFLDKEASLAYMVAVSCITRLVTLLLFFSSLKSNIGIFVLFLLFSFPIKHTDTSKIFMYQSLRLNKIRYKRYLL
jgi:hypothetical protein